MTRLIVDDEGKGCALEACPWLEQFPMRRVLPGSRQFAKRTVDVVIASFVLLLALPVLAVAAIAIKVTSPGGPVFFHQRRTGYQGRPFTLWKLRTMVPDAEARKGELAHLNARTWPDFKVEHDPRITRVGRLLRAASIDELPQLYNVLRGDMSLVGPRPTSLPQDKYALWQYERFDVRPGLTGLWQIAGRESSSFDHRLRLDIAYATRQSLWLDLVILVRTIPVVVFGRGAL
jgi:lipopolysaccharide/colanic/teichoic acid biosynthesis glycosyltransferase